MKAVLLFPLKVIAIVALAYWYKTKASGPPH